MFVLVLLNYLFRTKLCIIGLEIALNKIKLAKVAKQLARLASE